MLETACRSFVYLSWAVVLAVVLALPVHSGAVEPIYPLAIAAADGGPIYLADRSMPGVLKVTGDNVEVLFLADKKFRTPLNAVRCLAIDGAGKLLAGDSATREVYRFDDDGKPQPLTGGAIGIPMGIAVAASGELLVADLELHCIWKVPAAGGKPEKFASVVAPRGLAIDAQQRLWVVTGSKTPLVRIAADGKVEPLVKQRKFEFPHQLALDDQGAAYITDGYAKAIWKVTEGAEPTQLVAGEPLENPVGICRQGNRMLVVDPRVKGIFELSADGKLTRLPLK